MFPMQLLKILRPGTCMCKNHERQIGDARKRMETGILTEAYVGQHTYCGAPSLAKELLTVDIAKVNYDWVYNNIKENAGAQSRSVRARKNRDRHQKGRAAVLCFAELEALDLFLAERRPTTNSLLTVLPDVFNALCRDATQYRSKQHAENLSKLRTTRT